jgi:hypothetical protein
MLPTAACCVVSCTAVTLKESSLMTVQHTAQTWLRSKGMQLTAGSGPLHLLLLPLAAVPSSGPAEPLTKTEHR